MKIVNASLQYNLEANYEYSYLKKLRFLVKCFYEFFAKYLKYLSYMREIRVLEVYFRVFRRKENLD